MARAEGRMDRRSFFLDMAALSGSLALPMTASPRVFHADFRALAALDDEWQVATWFNGHPFGGPFSRERVALDADGLLLGFGGPAGTCAEVRTRRFWMHGDFSAEMRPANVPGSISAFFLYVGVAGTTTHHEIDIEFIGGTTMLHTNYWIAGRQHPVDIDLSALGIDPYDAVRTYGFSWSADGIAWHATGHAGERITLRRERACIAEPMQLMMNAWHGDNRGHARDFPGSYGGGAGTACYRRVRMQG